MLRGHGWMRLSALRSLFIAGSEIYFFVRRRRQNSGTKCRDNGAGRVIASASEAIQMARAKISIASSLSQLAMTRMRTFTSPRRGEVAGAAPAARGERGSELKPIRLPSPARRIAVAKLGRKRAEGTIMPGGDCCNVRPAAFTAVQERKSLFARPSNKCPASPICTAWGRCMAWGRRQTQNVHRPRLYVYTRTAVSRMRRSARVQRGRAIICSIAAGANCRSVACTRSAH